MPDRTLKELQAENQELRLQLEEAEGALQALRSGEVDAVLVVTDREQVYTLESADKPYRLLVEQMPQGAATLTIDGLLLYANRSFADLLGEPLQTLVGRPIRDFVAAEHHGLLESTLVDAQTTEVRRELTLQRSDGTKEPAYLGLSALIEGPLGMCLVVTDLTEQKHYRELQRAEDALREADRRKDEFLAILGHELRNPLGPIRNAARFLKLKASHDDELKRPIEMIERQVDQMTRLIDDLLDVSRISRGVLELRTERLSISDIVEAAVDACHDEIQEREHRLSVRLPHHPTELEADRVRLVQVLCNLIGNAVKYTPAGGRIEVAAVRREDVLVLTVKDDGIGIPRENLSEIFDLFAQVDRSLEREGGLGIGLTLSRELVKLHGGTIEARSDGPGRGSEFVLSLPVVTGKATRAVSPAAPEVDVSSTPRRILVADDNRDAVESLTLLLTAAGHQVTTAFSGEEALASARQVVPEVVLLDIGMPNGNGYDVARRIREHSWGKEVYLVALTGWGQDADRHLAREAGFDAHLVKPVAPEAIMRLLSSAVPQAARTLPRQA